MQPRLELRQSLQPNFFNSGSGMAKILMGYKIKRAEIHSIIMILKSKEGIFSNLTHYIYNVIILIRS